MEDTYCSVCGGRSLDRHDKPCSHCSGTGIEPMDIPESEQD